MAKISEVHWACVDHQRWIKDWGASCALAATPQGQQPQLHFMAGYDVHSQLLSMQQTLFNDERDKAPSTAIVVTSASLLMPILHHLPDRDFNVSMGYPLDRSPLFRLLESIMRMQSTARPQSNGETRYYWRSLLQCLQHPYVQMLQVNTPENNETLSLRAILYRMENLLRGGSRFATPQSLASQAIIDTTPEQRALMARVLQCLITNFESTSTPRAMADALSKLCDLLLEHGGDIWDRYPLDAESLYRLVQHIIPALKSSALADTAFPTSTLFALTRQLVQAERVPFEADPIAGLQILGMLETRLLNFDRVLVVDATDDALLGSRLSVV